MYKMPFNSKFCFRKQTVHSNTKHLEGGLTTSAPILLRTIRCFLIEKTRGEGSLELLVLRDSKQLVLKKHSTVEISCSE